jgi:hypothetical protein
MSTKVSIVNINDYESIPDAIVAAIKKHPRCYSSSYKDD